MRLFLILIILFLINVPTARGQDGEVSPSLVLCGGGSLPDTVYQRFLELAGPNPVLVFVPTASSRDFDTEKVQKLWKMRGFSNVHILHSNDRDVASSSEFVAPLKTATAVWFGGGVQQRIADAYLNTVVEEELRQLLRRGGVIGGTSAGAAIQSRVMIAGGTSEPRISTGFDLLRNAIVDQHFLKRNRITRLLAAVRAHPKRIGFGIDEGTSLVVSDGQAGVVGKSFVLRVELIDGTIKFDAFSDGDSVPLPKPQPAAARP